MRSDSFPYYRDQIFDLYNDRKYREALSGAFQAKERFPERSAKTSYWIGCLQSRLGESEEALRTLEKASKEGLWWPDQALLMEPDLELLQSRPEFKAIVGESQRLKQRALLRAKPGVMVLTPRNFSPEERHSLIIALTPRLGIPVNLRNIGTVLGIKGFFWLSRILRSQYPLKNIAGTTRSVQSMTSSGRTSKFGTSTTLTLPK